MVAFASSYGQYFYGIGEMVMPLAPLANTLIARSNRAHFIRVRVLFFKFRLSFA